MGISWNILQIRTTYQEIATAFGLAMTREIEPGPSFGGAIRTPREGCPYGAPKVCHPERRAKPEVEGFSHRMFSEQTVSAKILRLASLAQDDILGTAVPLSFIAATVGRSACGRPSPFMVRTGHPGRGVPTAHQKSVILSEGRSPKSKDLRTEFLLSKRQVRRSFDSLRSLRMTKRGLQDLFRSLWRMRYCRRRLEML